MKTITLRVLVVFIVIFSANVVSAQLNGTYTIGTNGTFKNFTEAVDTLVDVGVSGAVVFNVDTGTYAEQLTIPQITGASSVNTITFQSAAGDSTNVVLTYASTNDIANYTIKLNGADYIIFQKMTISATDTTYGRIIEITKGANNNQFLNNKIIGASIESNSNKKALIYTNTSGKFISNYFKDGSYGIFCAGDSSIGAQICNNFFTGQYTTGIKLSYLKAPLISGNTIIDTNYYVYYGMCFEYCDSTMIIEKNRISLSTGAYGRCIYLDFCDGTYGHEILISNNFISVNVNNSYGAGICLRRGEYQKIYNNNVNISGSNCTYSSSPIILDYNPSNIILKNNNFINTAQGFAYFTFMNTDITTNYNNYYSNGNVMFEDIGHNISKIDLSSWQAATGRDSNSVSIDPGFVSNSDLHCSNSLLNAGISLPEIVDDIDGQIRKSTPDIGADEFIFAGINNKTFNSHIGIYPNPNSGLFTLELEDAGNETLTLEIENINGQLIYSKRFNNNTIKQIDLTNQPKGLYFVKVYSDSIMNVKKIIIN